MPSCSLPIGTKEPLKKGRKLVGFSAVLAILLTLLLLLSTGLAQTFDRAIVDTFVTEQMKRNSIPGVALAITEGERVLYATGYGTAGQGVPMTADTPMYIGSVSKSFTALALLQLVEQGKIDLNAPVQTYLPWFTLADKDAAAKIIVQHLLGHSSGLSDLQYLELTRLANHASIEDGVRDLRRARPVAPVGSTFHYFNPGYATLGLIVETVSGQSYESYLHEHILVPLEMTRTYTDEASARQNGLAQGYGFMFGFAVPRQQAFRHYGLPAGYIISTANDMAHYLMALNNGGRYHGARVLSPRGVSALRQPSGPGNFYAKGWMVGEYQGLKLVQHGGANEFFKAEAMLLPEKKLGLVLLINQNYLPSAFRVCAAFAILAHI